MFEEIGKLDEAMDYYEKTLKIANSSKQTSFILRATALNNKALMHMRMK